MAPRRGGALPIEAQEREHVAERVLEVAMLSSEVGCVSARHHYFTISAFALLNRAALTTSPGMAPTFVALLSVLSGSLAYPSFRYKIPNGERVPCPEGAEGCTWTEDDILGLQGSWRCNGLGHSTCAGGGALNAFGVDFVAHTFEWQSVCGLDSDGDGDTNGEELGDPCCLLETGVGGSQRRATGVFFRVNFA